MKASLSTLKCNPLDLSKEAREELIQTIEAPAVEANQALKDAYQLHLKKVKSTCQSQIIPSKNSKSCSSYFRTPDGNYVYILDYPGFGDTIPKKYACVSRLKHNSG